MLIPFILLLIILTIILYKNVTFESFDTNCDSLYDKTGMICSIPSSPLFPSKCYRIKKTKEHPYEIYDNVNVDDCMYYPSCQTIGENCNAPNIAKLENGYVELI